MSSKLIRTVIALAICVPGIAPRICMGQVDSAGERHAPDHSCTVHGGYSFVMPAGQDGGNFKNGMGFEAGGGFGWTAWVRQPHPPNLFWMFDYGYSHADAKTNPVTPTTGTATTHGSFGMLSTGVLVRFYQPHSLNFYLGGGFGWFRRNIHEQANGTSTLTNLGAATLWNSTTSSGALDVRGGVNYDLKHAGGLMVFAGAHAYKGLAINHNTILVPITAGIRW